MSKREDILTQKTPHVFTIEPDKPFLKTLAAEIWRRADGDGGKLSSYRIFLPTRRACRSLGLVFAGLAGEALLLPRMRALGDIDEDDITFADAESEDFPPAIAPMKRLMLLTRQVQRKDPRLSWDQALLSAKALAGFLDEVQIARCDLARLPSLVEEQELADHWLQTLAFLGIVLEHWPAVLKDEGCLDPAVRRNKVLKAQAEAWRKNPPPFPVIAAGSTGTVPATAELLEVIARLPLGAVVLPGLDCGLEEEAWEALDETHPQHSMKKVLEKMGIARAQVQAFASGEDSKKISPRVRLLSEVFRPAATTDAWRRLRGKAEACATQGLTRVVLEHPQEEAQVIALRLREALETPGKKAALITPDRTLAARVAALLGRWGITVDDSGGAPLLTTALGAYLDLLLAAADPAAGHVDLLALLKHPFAACGVSQVQCRAKARASEVRVRKQEEEDFAYLKNLLRPLTETGEALLPLSARIAAHITVAEAVAATGKEDGASRLWSGETGQDVAAWLAEWRSDAAVFPAVSGRDYALLFHALAASKPLRSGKTAHSRLSILGPLESRLIDADLVILGGLNEGVWPPQTGVDPWMSRPMRRKLGLPAPEYRIGLSAHDFAQLAAAGEVMLTRSLRSAGQPTEPSRFLLQLDAVLTAAGLSDKNKDALADTRPWKAWAHHLDKPPLESKPCARPQPRPPLEQRPTKLSVTSIATWIRNPYAIYAEHILKLKKLEELDADLDAADRGILIHQALEEFSKTYGAALPPDAEARLVAIGRRIFSREDNPRIRAFWQTRFAESAAWFIALERQRRDAGEYPAGIEAMGNCELDGFTLYGYADRINSRQDGSLVIIDYKTGGVPTRQDVRAGIEIQLPLLALIAAAGGFKGVPQSEVSSCAYWALKGRTYSRECAFDKELPELRTKAQKVLKGLIAAFADPDTAYEAVPIKRLQPRYNDYAHLSRLAEWGRIEEEG